MSVRTALPAITSERNDEFGQVLKHQAVHTQT